jgi:hypothetical protein
MEARARDGLWSIRRCNVSTPHPLPVCFRNRPPSFFSIFFLNFSISLFLFLFCLFQLPINQLSCGRDLGRDGCDQDGHAYIRKDDARETRVARAHSPSALQQPREHHRAYRCRCHRGQFQRNVSSIAKNYPLDAVILFLFLMAFL